MAHRETGHIKWFSKDRGYGFIQVPEHHDYFFHITQVQGDRLPSPGDVVTFEPGKRNDERPQALAIMFVPAFAPSPDPKRRIERPYYGQQTFEYKKNEAYLTVAQGIAVGAFIGLLIGYFVFDGGWFLNSIISIVFAALGRYLALNQKDGPYIQGEEITSTCLKCGGTGQVTAREDGYIGFQCPDCKSFWKKREKHT